MSKISGTTINYKDSSRSNIENSRVHDNIDIRGVGNIVNMKKVNPVLLPIEEDYLTALIRQFGKWLIGKKKNVILSIITVPSLFSFYVIIDWKWFDFIGKLSNLQGWIRGFAIVWLVVIIGLFLLLKSEVCPKCKRLLAIRTIKREQIGKTEYKGDTIHNINETYKCDYCKYTFSEVVTEKE